MSRQDKFVLALTKRGWVEGTATRKYRVFEKDGRKLYLGKAGALRIGRTISGSSPVRMDLKLKLIGEADDIMVSMRTHLKGNTLTFTKIPTPTKEEVASKIQL